MAGRCAAGRGPAPGWGSGRVCRAAALLLAGAAAAVASCSRLERGVRILPPPAAAAAPALAAPRSGDFRQAFAHLDFTALSEEDLDGDSLSMMRGARAVMDGDLAGAERIFRVLAGEAKESWTRRTAGEILVQILICQSRWGELHRLAGLAPSEEGRAAAGDLPFRELSEGPAEEYRFPARPETLALKLSASGTPLLSVRIRGRKENFWLDTGSSFTVLASDLAARLRVSPLGGGRGLASTSANKRVAASLTVVDEMQVAGLTITRHPALIVSKRDLFFKIPGNFRRHRITKSTGVRGILGMNAIRHLSLRIDYRQRRITIGRPERRGSGARNLFWLGYPILSCRGANGARFNFGIDSGAWKTVVSPALLARIGPSPTYRTRLRMWGAGGEMKVRTQILQRLQLDVAGRSFEFSDVLILPLNYFSFIALDGILGSDFLSACGRVAFDMANGRFAVE